MQQQQLFHYWQPFQQAPRQPMQQQQQNGPSLEDLLKQMAIQDLQFQQRTEASIQNLAKLMGEMASSIIQLQAQRSSELLSQTISNSIENVSAITVRSTKEFENVEKPTFETKEIENKEKQPSHSKVEEHSVFHIDLMDDPVESYTYDNLCAEFPDIQDLNDTIDCQTCKDLKCVACIEIEEFLSTDKTVEESEKENCTEILAAATSTTNKLLSSIVQPPELEPEPPPDHMKYNYLEESYKIPFIIAKNLDAKQAVKDNEKAIDGTLTEPTLDDVEEASVSETTFYPP